MFVVGPTFFSNPGDHTPGDGVTRFQCAFAGASSADVSSYLIGSGTNDEMTVTDGAASALFDSDLNPKSLLWNNFSMAMGSNSSPFTAEIFFRAEEVNHDTGNIIKFAEFTFNDNGIDFYISSYPNSLTKMFVIQAGFSNVEHTWTTYGPLHHLAFVNRTTGGTDIYIDGTRIITARATWTLGSTGTVQLGGVGRGDTRMTYYGARVRGEEMYSGASFTPPSGPSAWGPP